MLHPDAIESSAVSALTHLEETLLSALDYTKALHNWKRHFYNRKALLNDAYASHNQAVQAILTLEADHPEMAMECFTLLEQAKRVLDLNKIRLQSYTGTKRVPEAIKEMNALFIEEVGSAYVEPDNVEISVIGKL